MESDEWRVMGSDFDECAGESVFCENTMFLDTWEYVKVLICIITSTQSLKKTKNT